MENHKNRTLKINIMKKIVFTLAVIVYATTSAIYAQTAIDNLYQQYAGESGFTSINISPEMFGFLSSIDMNDSSEKAKETQGVLDQLSGLKMLVYEPDSNAKTNEAFIQKVKSLSKAKGYSELMSIDSEDEKIKFLSKKGPDGKVLELLMIVVDEREAVIMSITGNLDMKSISQISKSLDIDGMENLEKIDE